MIKRRDVLGTGVLGGLLAALGAGEAAAASEAAPASAQRSSDPDVREIVTAIDRLRQQMASERSFTEISAIRDAQRTYLRANQKMPDFIEVGAGLWFPLYDWHVRWQQPLNLGRDAQGHYTILFMGTTVILRAENPDSYMSVPYDVK